MGLGVAQIEIQAQRESSFNIQSEKFRFRRNVGFIQSKMEIRIKDAFQDVREISSRVFEMKRRLKQILRKNEELHKKIFDQLECEMEVLRTKLQKKYDKKVRHIEMKFGDKPDTDTQCPVPPHLKKFKDIKLYSGQLEKKEVLMGARNS